jgi:hypothetical protein
VGFPPLTDLGDSMKFADFYGEIEIDDDELVNDDYQGHLVAEAHRIVAGDSQDPPTVGMLEALICELAWTRKLMEELREMPSEEIPF